MTDTPSKKPRRLELTERQRRFVEEAPPLTAHQIAVIRGAFGPYLADLRKDDDETPAEPSGE
jgi:hypothetical protein